jgi:hypothetical protein
MALININGLNKLKTGDIIDIKFFVRDNNINKLPRFLLHEVPKNIIIKKIYICDFLGEGSYGSVFKIKIDDIYYAIKLSENEVPHKMSERYKSLHIHTKLKKHIIKIYCCGEMNKNYGKYKYYCIMEFGGSTLKHLINNLNIREIKSILKQLYNIVYQSSKYRLLITDLKLANLTITNKNKLKLIDIYMDCHNYSPCSGCHIIKTYSTIEFDKEKRIYENSNYNFTGIYIPFAICLIDLICEHTINYYTSKICKNFNINVSVKQIVLLLQVSCYNYNNSNNNSIKKYKNIESYKKNLETQFSIIKTKEFYEYFMNLLEPKKEYMDFINKQHIFLIINDLLTIDPEQRSLKYLKQKLINEHTT